MLYSINWKTKNYFSCYALLIDQISLSDSPHFLRYSAIRVLWFMINYLLSSLGWHKIWTSIQCKNVQEFVKTVSWLLLTFLMFTQPIKFYTFYCHMLRVQMFKQGDSLNKQNKRLLLPNFYQQISPQNMSWFLSSKGKRFWSSHWKCCRKRCS